MENKDLARIINHPHDHYFKSTFGKKEVARDFLESYLPEEILHILDLETLSNQKVEYVDKKLKNFLTDLLYQVDINEKEGYVYILYEHKSYHDEKTIFQIFKYMVQIWDEHYDNKTKTIPAIIPILIYHGEKKLEIKTRLWDMIEGIEQFPETLKKMLPDFEFKAYDYSPKGEEVIKGSHLIQAILWMLKAIREKNKRAFQEGLNHFIQQLGSVAETEGLDKAMEYYLITMVYIFNTREDFTEEELQEALPQGGKIMETLAKRIYNNGRTEGKEEEKERLLLNFYNKGFPIEQIAEGLEITKEKALQMIQEAKNRK